MLLTLVVLLIVCGVLLWAIPQLPLDPVIAQVIRVIVIVALVIYAVQALTGVHPFARL